MNFEVSTARSSVNWKISREWDPGTVIQDRGIPSSDGTAVPDAILKPHSKSPWAWFSPQAVSHCRCRNSVSLLSALACLSTPTLAGKLRSGPRELQSPALLHSGTLLRHSSSPWPTLNSPLPAHSPPHGIRNPSCLLAPAGHWGRGPPPLAIPIAVVFFPSLCNALQPWVSAQMAPLTPATVGLARAPPSTTLFLPCPHSLGFAAPNRPQL